MTQFNIVPSNALGIDCKIINRVPLTRMLAKAPESIDYPVTLNEPVGDEVDVCVLDLETTGFNVTECEVIEIGLLRVSHSPSKKRFTQIKGVLGQLEQPRTPLEPIITKVTGLTDSDLEGRKIEDDKVALFMSDVHFVIAHNAPFDKSFFEKRFPQFNSFEWACSAQGDVDWRTLDYPSSSLPSVLAHQGFFYDAHRATIDCMATLWALHSCPEALAKLLDNYQKQRFLIKAVGAPFEVKDALKASGFRWDGNEKVWSIKARGMDDAQAINLMLKELYGKVGVLTPA